MCEQAPSIVGAEHKQSRNRQIVQEEKQERFLIVQEPEMRSQEQIIRKAPPPKGICAVERGQSAQRPEAPVRVTANRRAAFSAFS